MNDYVGDGLLSQDYTIDELLDAAIQVGRRLLASGAEISRVEESIGRIFLAYGLAGCDVFAIPSMIIVSIQIPGTPAQTRIIRIPVRKTNLDRVAKLNDLCRRISATTPDPGVINQELARIEASPVFGYPMQLFAFALISVAFALLFGGKPLDAALAGVCGVLLKGLVSIMARFDTNSFIVNFTGSAMTAVFAYGATLTGWPVQMDVLIIGTLMNLVPGVAITISMQDIMAGELMSGQSRLIEALLTAVAIALGTGFTLTALRMI